MDRIPEDLLRLAFLNHLAEVHNGDVIGDVLDD